MNGSPCLRRRKMMGRGADGGCGTEEKPCPISRVPAKIPAAAAEESPALGKRTETALDLYTQARKALTVFSPFDSEDVQVSTDPNLPGGLANYLSRQSDSKKWKKSHSGVETKSKRGGAAEKGRGSSIWDETADCFRELTVEDVEKIEQLSNFVNSALGKYLSVSTSGNVVISSSGARANDGNASNEVVDDGNASNGVVETVLQEEAKQEEPAHFMEVDSVGVSTLPEGENGGSSSPQLGISCSGLEWLLGSRRKVHLTTERPSKKRKLLGVDAGLEKLIMARPVSGSSTLCHCCSLGDSGNPLNRIIICNSCSVAVHERCYGVLDDGGGSWLCSWCKQRNAVKNSDRPCVLCPRSGGALKPISKTGNGSENGGPMEFAHLFCCQWMPEVYLEDTRTMEPVMNIKGIAESRKKLICYLCKVKCGACLRCSFGACRTSFHPMCAREASHRMEIWGKFGCDDVELRAFCSKHTEDHSGDSTQQSGNAPVAVDFDSSISVHKPVATTGHVVSTTGHVVSTTGNRQHKLKIGRKNGDKIAVHIESAETNVCKSSNSVLCEAISDTRSHTSVQLQSSDSTQPTSAEEGQEKGTICDVNTSDSLDFAAILQKLIERGRVSIDRVASEIGASPEMLASMLTGNHLVPEFRHKIVTWLRTHAYIGSSQKNLRVKFKSSVISKDDVGAVTHSDSALVSESVVPDGLPVKSVPPRRRTKSNIRILKDNKVISPSQEALCNDRSSMDEAQRDELISKDADIMSKESVADATKKLMEPNGHNDTLSGNFHGGVGDSAKPLNFRLAETDQGQVPVMSENVTPNSNDRNTFFLVKDSNTMETEAASRSDFHPLLCKMMRIQSLGLLNNATCSRNTNGSSVEASSGSDTRYNQHIRHWNSSDMKLDGTMAEQLVNGGDVDHLEMCPKDEVEGELIYHQHKLLSSMVARQCFSDELIGKVVRNLPQEIDASASRKWDAVFVSQYLSKLREAKKQGRKERRHKEAQAVLAAATAAAAASSRISSFRKDVFDEAAPQENSLNASPSTGRGGGPSSQQISRPNQSLPKLGAPPVLSDAKSDFLKSVSASSKEQPRTCDVCRRTETILNPVLVCSSCKVLVHLDCYRNVKDSAGPWRCELCEDILSRSSEVLAVNSWPKPTAECGLCGGHDGAFRKSIDGQWVHAFCAEWVLESTFRRGQAGAVQGMESVLKGTVVCHICHRKEGACVKCNYGNCQSTFHPSCARRSGLHMTVKTCGGKLLHKAYCERHSSEQKAKGEKHGIEELKSLKQIRVELERLRLLCERIIKREKLKRELVVCSQEILVSNKDSVALTALIHSPFFPPDVSSESATTSLRGNTEDCRSGNETIQRSDDVTVDSTVSGKRRVRFPASMDNDQKTDDSSTSQHLYMPKPRERVSSSGKQIPQRLLSIAQDLGDDDEKRIKSRKHAETFKKELVMTSDQACVRNQRLPKGIFYVPIGSLSKEKETFPDALSGKTVDNNG